MDEARVLTLAAQFGAVMMDLGKAAVELTLADETDPRLPIIQGNVDAHKRRVLEVLARIDAECGAEAFRVVREAVERIV